MVEISEVDSASNLPVVHGMASQMGPPPPNPPRSGQVHGPSVGIGSTAGSSTPSSQPSQTCAADECVSNNPEVGVQISWVWGHYNIYQNGERAKCKHCEISNYKIGECFKKKEKRKEKRKEKKKKLEKAIQLSETGANLSSSFAPPEESSPPLADQSPGREKGISSSGQGSGRSVEVLAPLPVEREDSFDDPLYRAAAMGHPSLEPSSMVALGATSTSDNSRDDLALFHGPPFVKIKQEAADQNKWLLVNVESIKMEFGSDMLNRATWNDKVVAQLIRTKFIFWQVHDDTTEGRQVCNYYNLVSVPVVLLLDPISGKKMRLWSGMIRPRPLLKIMKIINISSYLAIVTLLVLITIPSSESYTNHTVGGASGWYFNRSSNKSITDYSKWASGKTFNLGDYLIFDTNTNQTVIQTYNETAYKICNADDTTDASVYSGGAEIGKQVVLSVPLIIEGADSCPMEFPRCSIETYFLTMAREKIKEKSKTCN